MKEETKHALKNKLPIWLVCVAGIAVLSAAYIRWRADTNPSVAGNAAAVCSLVLFIVGCCRFVPGFLSFRSAPTDEGLFKPEPKHILLGVAGIALAVELLLFAAVTGLLRKAYGNGFTFRGAIEFWRSLDSQHYLDITREWYLSDGDWGRVVQLVFLPGYPLAVYPLYRIIGSDIIAGLVVSGIAFPAACCVLYRLLRLDYDWQKALRAVVLLLLMPGGFFFLAPMSESLYLLLVLSALLCMRKKHWLLAGLLGAYASFTRTVGLLLVAPMILEWARAFPGKGKRLAWIRDVIPALLVPVGFLAYLWINRTVSGNALQFLYYQEHHWSQKLGWFFNTASYQTEYLLGSIEEGNRYNALGLWLPNLVWHFGTLLLFAITAKKLRSSYAAWFIAYFAIAIGTTWLLSGPRYLLSMPAVAMMLAAVTEKRWQKIAAVLVLLPFSAFYLYAFVSRWQVW
ncbi:MAG: hypothetical protein II117_03195 [Clostridia bacterium]|nr:hypothetical protein [Clostridia bacterium]